MYKSLLLNYFTVIFQSWSQDPVSQLRIFWGEKCSNKATFLSDVGTKYKSYFCRSQSL